MAGISDSGSNYKFFDRNIETNPPRSGFDTSYLNHFDADLMWIYPHYWQYTHPNEDFELSVECLVKAVNPPVVALASRQRVFFHYYWQSFASISKEWEIAASGGHSGNYVAQFPKVKIDLARPELWSFGSLMDFAGFKFAKVPTATTGEIVTPFNAFKLMAYQQIYRDFYMKQQYHSSGDADEYAWFPFYDGDFRFDVGEYEIPLDFNELVHDDADGKSWSPQMIGLGQLRKRPWTDDYFTSATPWPQRGNPPEIALDSAAASVPVVINVDGVDRHLRLHGFKSSNGAFSNLKNNTYLTLNLTDSASSFNIGGLIADYDLGGSGAIETSGELFASLSGSGLNINMAQLRELNSAQRILEKMAHTNGTYHEFVKTFFGISPKNAQDHRPIYVGGAYQTIQISDVLQTGGTQREGDQVTSVQGTQTGYAKAYEQGYIGRFKSTDYGILVGVMMIIPDTYYAQGLSREDTMNTKEDLYLPERAGLSPQAILSQELYYDIEKIGIDPMTNPNVNVFAYQNRWDELRYRANEVHGKVSDPSNTSWSPYIQTRFFSNRPMFNEKFILEEPSKDWLTSADESAYLIDVATRVRAVKPLPYKARPAELMKTY